MAQFMIQCLLLRYVDALCGMLHMARQLETVEMETEVHYLL